MVNRILQSLESHIGDPLLGSAIRGAIAMLSESQVEREEGPSGSGQSSKSVADLHAFRKRTGYYKAGAVAGLEETITSLGRSDSLVWARVIETSRSYLAMWFDDQDTPLGILVFEKEAI
jgi:hypothetical protein